MTSKPQEERVKVLLVFIRECDTTEGKVGRMFYRITREEFDSGTLPEDLTERTNVYGPKVCKLGSPGQVYEINASSETADNVYIGSERYLERWPNKEDCLKWELDHRAYVNERDAKKREKSDKGDSVLKETLAPLRELYQRTPYSRKQALLAAILYEITY